MRPIPSVAADLGLHESDLDAFGSYAAKLRPEAAFKDGPPPASSRLILVSAINPTPAGEGKTTVSVGLTQAARMRGVKVACALRQPSQGPVFGLKGGGTGGGRSMLQPMERINLHFTGDFHAIGAANNLLAALIDNDIYFGGESRIDGRQVSWRRAIDMNDRFLRKTIIGLGGKAMGTPREDGFDITAASEVMAILALSTSWTDLKERLARIVVGYRSDGSPVFARDLRAEGAMAALLRDALLPNLVQTTEGAPALVHAGPFANIAHGCNSIVATRAALHHADVVFTEAGFGFDLGAEKFLDIKCRAAGLWPHAVVLVATLKALKMHGGVPVADAGKPNRAALLAGMANLEKHIESVRAFGLEPIVAFNVFGDDTDDEFDLVRSALAELGVESGKANVFAQGGEGALELVDKVLDKARASEAKPKFLYELDTPIVSKIERIATTVYGARSVIVSKPAVAQIARAQALGYGSLPICMAKTHLSLSDDDKRPGRPRDFDITIREVRVSAGAGFIVALTGDILTMPGLQKVPSAANIDLQPDGTITGVR